MSIENFPREKMRKDISQEEINLVLLNSIQNASKIINGLAKRIDTREITGEKTETRKRIEWEKLSFYEKNDRLEWLEGIYNSTDIETTKEFWYSKRNEMIRAGGDENDFNNWRADILANLAVIHLLEEKGLEVYSIDVDLDSKHTNIFWADPKLPPDNKGVQRIWAIKVQVEPYKPIIAPENFIIIKPEKSEVIEAADGKNPIFKVREIIFRLGDKNNTLVEVVNECTGKFENEKAKNLYSEAMEKRLYFGKGGENE